MPVRLPLPREHGAWGMVIQSFAAGALLTREWTWLYLPAFAATILAFAAREPLLTLARQRWIWKTPRPESRQARALLAGEMALLAGCAVPLFSRLSPMPLLALGALTAAMTVLAVHTALQNRQRSVLFQVVTSLGLNSAALFAYFAGAQALRRNAWILWLALSLHSAAAIFVVHARLQARALKMPGFPRVAAAAQAVQGVLVAAAGALIPALFSAAANLVECMRLMQSRALAEPLTHVGFRTLGIAIVHAILAVIVLAD
jgi:hypothetical protein